MQENKTNLFREKKRTVFNKKKKVTNKIAYAFDSDQQIEEKKTFICINAFCPSLLLLLFLFRL